MAHYYDLDPSLESKERLIEFVISERKIALYTDNGVFSKSKLDEGSRILIETLLPLGLTGRILDLGCGYGPIGLSIGLYHLVQASCLQILIRAQSRYALKTRNY